MVRWDSPLFTVLWSDDGLPNESIWEAITKGNIKPPNSGTLNVRLTPSTANPLLISNFSIGGKSSYRCPP